MREWLSGGASPSQGEGRGFESRLALDRTKKHIREGYAFFRSSSPILDSKVQVSPLRFGRCSTEVPWTSYTVSRLIERKSISVKDMLFSFFESNPGLEGSSVSTMFRSVQNQGPPDLVLLRSAPVRA